MKSSTHLRVAGPSIGSIEFAAKPVMAVQILGENLALYRNEQVEYGLLAQRCLHRGASLAYGIPEEGGLRRDEELDHAVRQLVSQALTPGGVVDIFAAAGLGRPNLAILPDEFLAEVQGLPQRNLAVERLERLLNDEIKLRAKKNLVQARSFCEMLEKSVRAYQQRGIQTVLEQAALHGDEWLAAA